MIDNVQNSGPNSSYVELSIPDEQNTNQNNFQDGGLQFIYTNYELNNESSVPSTTVNFNSMSEG